MKKFLFVVIAALLCWFGTATAEQPQYGGTLRVLNLGAGLNPLAWDNAAWQWKHGHDTGLVLEHLFVGDLQKGPRGTGEYAFGASAWIPPSVMRGELVERWEKEQNPLALVFYLRKGVYWQARKGVLKKKREFTAEDVVYSMDRLKNARKAIPTYVDWAEWSVRDKYTVVAKLKKWNANWFYRFGWGYYDGIQAKEQETGKAKGAANNWRNVTGTGPYMVTKVRKEHSQEYTRNKHYWDSTIIDGKKYKMPFANKVIYMLMKDPQARIAALRTGKVDMLWGINARDRKQVQDGRPELKFYRALSMGGLMVSMRMDTKPFDDIRVRRALNYAVNQQEIIDTLLEGEGELVNYPFPVTFKEVYTPYKDLPKSAQDLFSYNPERAKKLLAEAGYADGFTIDYYGYRQREYSEAIIGYLKAVGIKTNLKWLQYRALRPKTWDGSAQLVNLTWGSYSVNDVSAITSHFFKHGKDDYAHDPDAKKWLDIGDGSTDPAVRKDAYQKALTIIADKAYWVPLFPYAKFYVFSKELNFTPTPDEIPRFFYAKWN